MLPRFSGTIKIPITEEVFVRSSYSSGAPETITGADVSTYKITLGANETTLGKTGVCVQCCSIRNGRKR